MIFSKENFFFFQKNDRLFFPWLYAFGAEILFHAIFGGLIILKLLIDGSSSGIGCLIAYPFVLGNSNFLLHKCRHEYLNQFYFL